MILGRAYLKEIGLHLVMVLGGVTFLVALGAAVRASASSQGAPIWFPLALMPLLVGNVLPYLVSVTLLVAVILTYGRMAADREEMALRAMGMHPLRLILPAILAGSLMAAAVYPFSSMVMPEIYSKMRDLTYRLRYAMLENVDPPASELQAQGLHMLWRGRDPDGAFRAVTLYFQEREAPVIFPGDPGVVGAPGERSELPEALHIRADRARMSLDEGHLVLTFEGARTFGESGEDKAWAVPKLDRFDLRIDLESLTQRTIYELKPDDYTSQQLRLILGAGKLDGRPLTGPEIIKYRFALWRRVAIALSSVLLAVLGAMLGWRLRRGGFLPAFAAACGALFFFFYPFYYLGNALSRSGTIDPMLGAFLPDLALLPVLAVLSRFRR